MRDQDGGHGVHRGVLDTVVPDAGGARAEGVPGQRAACEERAWPQERRKRLPVATVSACGRAVAGQLPALQPGVRGALADALSGEPGGDGYGSSPAYAEGAGSDEPATAPRDQRSERDDRDGYSGRDPGRGTRPAQAGGAARSAHQGKSGDDREVAGLALIDRKSTRLN